MFHNFIEQISDYTEMVSQRSVPRFVLLVRFLLRFMCACAIPLFVCVAHRLEYFKNTTTKTIQNKNIIRIFMRFLNDLYIKTNTKNPCHHSASASAVAQVPRQNIQMSTFIWIIIIFIIFTIC